MDLKSRIIARLRSMPSSSKLNTLCDQLDKRAKELERHNPNEAHTAIFALCCKIVRMKYALDNTPLQKG